MKSHRERDHWQIVLAEDIDEDALLIETALERASPIPVQVHRARNGDEAIIMIEDLLPDLILLDLQMPGKTGHEVLEVIKRDDALRRIPVAVLSGSDSDDDVARSYGLGINHFIRKPEDPAQLEQQLRVLLEYAASLSGRSGSGNPDATAISAINPDTEAVRRLLLRAALVVVVVGLVVFAYVRGI